MENGGFVAAADARSAGWGLFHPADIPFCIVAMRACAYSDLHVDLLIHDDACHLGANVKKNQVGWFQRYQVLHN